ncbi:hypothetical protein HNY73_004693 [Argiope bruennichi]|uniref:Uncharacterized protein n=1 Tax=Argiope bruennichi TaxID=94029 RepID=A0A8T0FPQ5_ARGBR|nr:hypothetical protein HNY73_004693 [Argiope bruennichi]
MGVWRHVHPFSRSLKYSVPHPCEYRLQWEINTRPPYFSSGIRRTEFLLLCVVGRRQKLLQLRSRALVGVQTSPVEFVFRVELHIDKGGGECHNWVSSSPPPSPRLFKLKHIAHQTLQTQCHTKTGFAVYYSEFYSPLLFNQYDTGTTQKVTNVVLELSQRNSSRSKHR